MEEKRKEFLPMYGGIWGGMVPLAILIVGLVWLSVAERGGTKPFWACGWLALAGGLFFAKDKAEYCKAAMRGIGNQTGIVIVTAGGLVNGLLWLGMSTGAQEGIFTTLVFITAMLFSLGTGTSTGTCLSLTPVLYPAGIFLGCDPVLLGTAILSGAAFGDNLAPISDTTIVSAYTQGAEMRDVVRSRFPLAMAVVVVSALMGRHIIESLIYGNVCAMLISVAIGTLHFSDFFGIPEAGQSTGLIQSGIDGVVGAIIFAVLILAVTQILVECGILEKILEFANRSIVATVSQAELFIIGVTVAASIPISANAPALLLVGPSLVRPMGEKFNLAAARRANLMDCAVCTIFFILPWHIAVAVWYGALVTASETWGFEAPAVSSALMNPYSWALLAVILFSALTGWNRKFENSGQTT